MKKTVNPDKPRVETYALVIGIEEYEDISLGQASFAERDAEELYRIFTEAPIGTLPKKNVELLLSKDADVRNLGRAIRRMFRRVTPLDTVFLYFAGHGKSVDTGGYLLPRFFEDTEDADMDTEAYSFSSLNHHLRARRPRNFLFLIDCCFSGKALEQIDLNYDVSYRGAESHKVRRQRNHVRQNENDWEPEQQCRMVFCSCLANEQAVGISNLGHGIFSNFLIEGLKGEADQNGDGRVDVEELVTHVKGRMSSYNKEHNIYQNPASYQRVTGKFFLPSWDKIPSNREMKVYSCPICGRRNREGETFHCKSCGRNFLCIVHQVKGSWVCEECGQGTTNESTYIDPYTGMQFVFVKGACFEMGDTFGDRWDDQWPVHEVELADFWIGKYPVTQEQWVRVMGDNPSHFKKGDDYPVETVSWDDIQEFLAEINGRTGKKYRLPTEAEWEYAARSGGKKEKWVGTSSKSKLGEYAWYSGNSESCTHPVGQKKPNGLGLYDMSGNVWEWCEDWYDKNYYKSSTRENPKGPPTGKYRVLRGGSWGCNPDYLRLSHRYLLTPSGRVCNPVMELQGYEVWFNPWLQLVSAGFRLVVPPG